jgi:hypothetical protein
MGIDGLLMSMVIDLICGSICNGFRWANKIRTSYYLQDRKCRVCGEVKNLIEGFYRTRKDRGPVASSYSYECKECTIKE